MSDTFIGDAGGIVTNDVQVAAAFRAFYGIRGNDIFGATLNGEVLLDGGEGDDTLISTIGSSAFGVFYGGDGNDRIAAGATTNGDSVYGGRGNDIVTMIQNDVVSDDYIDGGQGRDSLSGGRGKDFIYGGDGDDSGADILAAGSTGKAGLFGEAGDDTLDGGRGKDLLNGGRATDLLIGGLDDDVFDFDSVLDSAVGRKRDVILDFTRGDRIDLRTIDAQSGSGNQDFDFIGSRNFTGDKGDLRFKGGILAGDTDGDRKADFEIKLAGVNSLKGADILL